MCTLIFMSPMMAQDGTWALTTFMLVCVAMTIDTTTLPNGLCICLLGSR